MTDHRLNAFDQPIGPDLPDWTPRPRPPRTPMEGRTCRVVPLDAEAHAAGLFAAYSAAPDVRGWTYLPDEMPESEAAFRARLDARAASEDPLFHAVLDRATGAPLGITAYLRIDPGNGVIEVGHLHFGPSLQRSPASTEAMALMVARAFDDLGYRRYEWKCDSLNAPSRAAALRLGFTFEGLFRNAVVVKGRSRDTAWFSITDAEWPRIRAGFAAWLDPANFDAEGRQRRGLAELRTGTG
ncbi:MULTISPECIES: GNAT family protein [unclassified Methylobacterium]|uniref:GNAT family N-acetyltransferase n=1 Tax=unclassified Methylobacterium TaxID=2615210 RepID=UPI0011C1D9A0|nr:MULTISPECIES: GNAT family protein [unclassified Methylobacterium]QEE38061.1 GNAT family N-acetyltransferase [Methylobacterium sp. WL1]TXN59904.1 GNAT family N-acetyltransferase [Methylobacterium sp. WL2]